MQEPPGKIKGAFRPDGFPQPAGYRGLTARVAQKVGMPISWSRPSPLVSS